MKKRRYIVRKRGTGNRAGWVVRLNDKSLKAYQDDLGDKYEVRLAPGNNSWKRSHDD